MSIQSEISRISGNIDDAYSAVSSKGGTVPASPNSDNLPNAIMSIPAGITPSGTLTITVNGEYNVTNYAKVVVQVAAGVLESISISGTARTQTVGEDIDTTGLTVTALYSDSTTEDVTDEVTWSASSRYDASTHKWTSAGSSTIVASYNGKTASKAVTVAAAVDYFTFTALESTTIALVKQGSPGYTPTLQYQKNSGSWTNYTIGSNIQLAIGDTLKWKGDNDTISTSYQNYYHFTATGDFGVSGNIMTLLDSTGQQLTLANSGNYTDTFNSMFVDNAHVTSAPKMPATTLVNGCYSRMFRNCTNLTTLPELPATGTLPQYCYQYTFDGCSKIILNSSAPGTAYRVPTSGSATAGTGSISNMFTNTGGSITSITLGTTYYLASAASTHTITASAGSNGSISPSGAVSVADGASQQFTFTPSSGYEVDAIRVDGATVTKASTYTFSNVTSDHTINVTFKVSGGRTPTTRDISEYDGTMVTGDIVNVPYINNIQNISLPAGTYQFELWGADGGNNKTSADAYGGIGGYTTGTYEISSQQTVYLVTGGAGDDNGNANTLRYGGYNNGPTSGTRRGGSNNGGTGGGATHVATVTGLLHTLSSSSNQQKVLAVAGAGGGAMNYRDENAGYGGGSSGGAAEGTHGSNYNAGSGGTNSSGGAGGTAPSGGTAGAAGGFGYGGNAGITTESTSSGGAYCGGGGGAGWYGGGGGSCGTGNNNGGSGGGGSGFVRSSSLPSGFTYVSGSTSAPDSSHRTRQQGSPSSYPSERNSNGYIRVTAVSV